MALIKIKQINNSPASAGDVITFDGSINVWAPTDPDQNLWETITADSGSTTANTTTDTLNILGTSSEIITSVVSDTMFIGIDDNAVLPGIESVTLPTGTTAQRPGTPIAGMLRFNTTLNCTEEYDGTDWTCFRTEDTLVGGLYQMIFTVNGNISNAWMDQGGDNILSNKSFAICLAQSKVIAFTFTNSKIDVDVDLQMHSTPEGIDPTVQQDLDFTWSLRAVRSARKSNFATDIIFEAGDKIGVFSENPALGGKNPFDAVFIVFLQYLAENNEEVIDNNDGDFS